jgi:nucleoside-diphosphate-sugar epimerase
MPTLSTGATVAVTGANGFIGAWVCSELLAQGFRVRAVVRDANDAARYGFLLSLPGAGGGSLTLASGTLSPGGYDEAFAGVDGVVHTVAVVEVLDSTDADNRILRPALEGTRVALESAAKAGSVRRFVVLSSVAAVHSVLGMPDSHVFTEADWNGWSTLASDATHPKPNPHP